MNYVHTWKYLIEKEMHDNEEEWKDIEYMYPKIMINGSPWYMQNIWALSNTDRFRIFTSKFIYFPLHTSIMTTCNSISYIQSRDDYAIDLRTDY